MDNKSLALKVARILDSKKAIDITILDIGSKSGFADYLILCSGGSERQIETLKDEVEEKLQKENIAPRSIEGKKESGWILMDYGDVIISVLTLEMRDRYNIEKVWGDCDTLDFE